MMKTVYVLGAGFNKIFGKTKDFEVGGKAFDVPMDSDFMEYMFIRAEKDPKYSSYKSGLSFLADLLHHVREDKVNIIRSGGKGLEDLISKLYALEQNPSNFFPASKKFGRLAREIICNNIASVLWCLEQRGLGNVIENTLYPFAKHCLYNANVSILTFNYDCFIERLFEKVSYKSASEEVDSCYASWDRVHSYGVPFKRYVFQGNHWISPNYVSKKYDPSAVKQFPKILKLHGSVNWSLNGGVTESVEGKVKYVPTNSNNIFLRNFDWEFADINPGICGKEGKGKNGSKKVVKPAIVPPVNDKYMFFKSFPWLKKVWEKAKFELESADEIVVVGYSFPKSDLFATKLFKNFKKKKGLKVCVVNVKSSDAFDLASKLFETEIQAEYCVKKYFSKKGFVREANSFRRIMGT